MKGYDSKKDTEAHIQNVKVLLLWFVNELHLRGIYHDLSKLETPEKEIFDEMTPKLAGSTYGSEEYKGMLADMKPALDHHYKENRHHPEHFSNDIGKMNLVDIVEMFFDWKAATLRHDNGDINKSIEINAKRFGVCDQLKNILHNTVEVLGDFKP